MNRKGVQYSAYLLFVVLLGVTLWGCPKKTEVSSSPEVRQAEPPAAPQAAPPPRTEAEQGEKAKAEEPKEKTEEKAPAAQSGLQPVYFDFDKSFIRPEARDVLKANAEWLKAHPQARIRIEGNCDERGTIEYNQALGQRRAASAKKYLTDLGISVKRISLVSYGKEKPVCTESAEGCWQKNRRDDFITVK